jgi:Rod binding domain-containing protein
MSMMRAVANVRETEPTATPRLVRAAHEFEAQMMKELLRPLTQPDEGGSDTGSEGALSEFAGEALGQSLSRAGGFGMADRILATLSRNETNCEPGSVAGKNANRGGLGLK